MNKIVTFPYDTLFHYKSDNPKISVIIPHFKYIEYIFETLTSLENQIFKDFEIIIVDDKSPSDTKILLKWCKDKFNSFNGLKYIRLKENQGQAIARNTAIEQTSSELIFFLDSDNRIFPKCLEILYSALIQNDQFAFAYCSIATFGDRTALVSSSPWDPQELIYHNYIDIMALVKKSVLLKIGAFSDMKRLPLEDYDLWLKMIESKEKGLWVPQILAQYRVHDASTTALSLRNDKTYLKAKKFLTSKFNWIKL